MKSKIVEKFSTLGTTEVSSVTNDTFDSMSQVFTEYPNKFFTQDDFVKQLNKSNPFINHQLHKLLKSKFILREGSKRKYFYKKVQ